MMRHEATQREGLEALCKELLNENSIVVELGSYCGESAYIFSFFVKRIYCIDPWVDVLEQGAMADGSTFLYNGMKTVEATFDQHVAGLKNVVKIRAYSNDVTDIIADKSIDLVYIDALHPYPVVRNDIDRWWRKVKLGGYLGGHNYHPSWHGVVKAVDESFKKPDHTYVDSSWAVKKIKGRKHV